MNPSPPLVSVCMLAYNVGPWIALAIEGVLSQRAHFPIELVIGEDGSRDDTRAVCARYAEKYPERIRLLPSDINRGIAGNAARTLRACRGNYLAICDGDDIWLDPDKLSRQMAFLETHPEFGLSYTDVVLIDEHGNAIPDPAPYRAEYQSGNVFFALLQGNFVNNSTVLVRRDILDGHRIDEDPGYFTHDYFMWLHCAVRTKFHFDPTPAVGYRRHSGGATRSASHSRNNRQKQQRQLFRVLDDFDRNYPHPLTRRERALIFRKLLSLLYRRQGTPAMKLNVLRTLPRYFPGIRDFWVILAQKTGAGFLAESR